MTLQLAAVELELAAKCLVVNQFVECRRYTDEATQHLARVSEVIPAAQQPVADQPLTKS